jgi:hypothetical protein
VSGRPATPQRLAFFQRLSAVPAVDAEPAATEGLDDAEAAVRREAALALAALARTRSSPRLQDRTIEALLRRLESESAVPVSTAVVEALEASGDERAAQQLSSHASRARLTWRLRLSEAAALVRLVRAATDRAGSDRGGADRAVQDRPGRPESQAPTSRSPS